VAQLSDGVIAGVGQMEFKYDEGKSGQVLLLLLGPKRMHSPLGNSDKHHFKSVKL
jgi:hypothetical protein